jgi:hypothetical protein
MFGIPRLRLLTGSLQCRCPRRIRIRNQLHHDPRHRYANCQRACLLNRTVRSVGPPLSAMLDRPAGVINGDGVAVGGWARDPAVAARGKPFPVVRVVLALPRSDNSDDDGTSM